MKRIILCLLGIFSYIGTPLETSADTVSLGFIDYPSDLNVLSSPQTVARLLRAGVTNNLIERSSGPVPYRLSAADSLGVSADRLTWSFRVRANESFPNGQPVSADDVVFSIESCRKRGALPGVSTVASRRVERVSGVFENWVDLTVTSLSDLAEHALKSKATFKSEELFPLSLGDCPIVERSSAELFGTDLGYGSNLIGSGRYYISDFNVGRDVTMTKTNPSMQEGASTIVLRSFRDPLHGLTALRTGTIDALFQPTGEVIEKAQKDPTLEITDCLSDRLVLRKGFNLSCNRVPNLSKLRYIN